VFGTASAAVRFSLSVNRALPVSSSGPTLFLVLAALLLPASLWISLSRWPAAENARHVSLPEYAPSLPVQIRLLALTVTFLRARLLEPVQLFLVLA